MGTDEPVPGRWWRNPWARSMYVVTGVAFGSAVALTSPSRGSMPWLIWAALAVSLTAASGAVFGYGLARWPEIVAPHRPSRKRLTVYVARVLGVAVGMLLLAFVLSTTTQDAASILTRGSFRGPLLVAFAGVAALPVVAGMGAIYEHARMPDGATPGARAETVLVHRRILTGLLSALGSQVTLATLALGAAGAVNADQPNEVVLVFGAAWSAVIAVAYAPASGALRIAAVQLCRAAVPLADVEPHDLPDRVDERHQLEQALGVERSPFADLESGILVLSPLIASAVSLFLPD